MCTEAIATSSSEGNRRYILHPIEAGPATSTRGSTYTILDPRLMFHGLPQLFLDRFPQLNEMRGVIDVLILKSLALFKENTEIPTEKSKS